jgi:hypothetical protein
VPAAGENCQQQQQAALPRIQKQEQIRQHELQTGQQQQQQYWQLPLPLDRIHWVNSLQGIQHMQDLLLGQQPSSAVPGADAMDASCMPVVGIDCEWRPYDRQQASTPVALLQLATRNNVFLIDMLAVCTQQQQQQQQLLQQPQERVSPLSANNCQTAVVTSSSKTSSACASDASTLSSINPPGVAGCWNAAEAGDANNSAEMALGMFLLELFTNRQVFKLGFQLQSDLKRLQVSQTATGMEVVVAVISPCLDLAQLTACS